MKNPDKAQTPTENPPSYDIATESGSGSSYDGENAPLLNPPDAKTTMNQPLLQPNMYPGPSYTTQPQNIPQPTVYNYVNPMTGEQVVSLLPPGHPEMICLQAGGHVPETHYGLLGILAAVFWFPLGIGLCLLDRRIRCKRCGVIIDDGICG
ncbi:hypothetical protein JR316_0001813 [Psilocybe cubensis]|uniref:Uncharacterized protein n=2 Tax=Psilocybe cubensis TaxID=181762 RepID=A0ACB8HAG5_PSICU|nr:hypothetical protein JR316_0001813 [Psilocybe cubensis]KAH9484911.1 hypothetical protein JR316_0001813 [Psilocybe cubensis]